MNEQFSHLDPKLTASSQRRYDSDGVIYMSEQRGDTSVLDQSATRPHDHSHARAETPPPESFSDALHRVKSSGGKHMRMPTPGQQEFINRVGIPEQVQEAAPQRNSLHDVEKAFELVADHAKDSYWDKKTVVPGELVRKRGKDHKQQTWENDSWGTDWSAEQLKTVGTRLQHTFDISKHEVQNCLELLYAGGKLGKDVLADLTEEKAAEIKQALDGMDNAGRDKKMAKLNQLMKLGIVRQDYARKFVLTEDFEYENESEHSSSTSDIEMLAWQMLFQDVTTIEKYGVNGKYPLLEMRIVKDKAGKVDPQKSRYYVNEGNMIRWLRANMDWHHQNGPDEAHNFFEKIQVNKRGQYGGRISLSEMVFGGRLFKSEDGELMYEELNKHFQMLPLVVYTLRSMDVGLKGVLGDKKGYPDAYKSMMKGNPLTKEIYRSSMLGYLMTMPIEFQSANEGQLPHSDSVMGMVVNEMIQAYYNLADIPELKKVLGENSSFFRKEHWAQAMHTAMKEIQKQTGQTDSAGMAPASYYKSFEAAFDEEGKIKGDGTDFINFVNYLEPQSPPALQENTVKVALMNAIKERYQPKLPDGTDDTDALSIANVIAFSCLRWTNISARLDVKGNCYDFASKLENNRQNRYKQNIDRGGSAGNILSIDQFKSMVMDPLESWQTNAERYMRDTQGNVLYDSQGKPRVYNMSAQDVLMEAQRFASESAKHIQQFEAEINTMPDNSSKRQKEQDLEKLKQGYAATYNKIAAKMAFKRNTMSAYGENHYNNMVGLWDDMINGREVSFEKFTTHDFFRGVTFQTEAFQKEMKEDLMKRWRYGMKTFGGINFDKIIRAREYNAETKKVEFKNMPIAEKLFGYQVLNRKEYWKAKPDGSWAYDEQGRHAIDYARVQDNQSLLWKQAVLMKLAADLAAHRDVNSNNPVYDISYYDKVHKAIASIPNDLDGDENDLYSVSKGKGRLFTKEDMRWLKNISKTDSFSLYTREFWTAMIMPKGEKKSTFFGELMKAIITT